MRFVLCDDDRLLAPMVESLLSRLGHEVVGTADDTAAAVRLVAAARPDAVIVDLALDYNSDFDVIEASIAVGARTVVFSHTADEAVLGRYEIRPVVVPKPDIVELERVIGRLDLAEELQTGGDRRRRPARAATGPPPTGLADAQAFFEALGAAVGGDALVAVDLPAADPSVAESIAALVAGNIRDTDRVLASPSSIRAFLPGAEDDGIASLVGRLARGVRLPEGVQVRSVVVAPDEIAADAFDRLKSAGALHDLDTDRRS